MEETICVGLYVLAGGFTVGVHAVFVETKKTYVSDAGAFWLWPIVLPAIVGYCLAKWIRGE